VALVSASRFLSDIVLRYLLEFSGRTARLLVASCIEVLVIGRMADFILDDQLAVDTAFVADWALSRVLLMNDARFVWLILVPRRPNAGEIFDLSVVDRGVLTEEFCRAGKGLKALTVCDKVNICAIGNMVPQLHVHVIARRADDGVWPSPVWSRGYAVPYEPGEMAVLVKTLVNGL
jgi:diadenosine tetraphosphate (Ap4A) HIT family hydrolase